MGDMQLEPLAGMLVAQKYRLLHAIGSGGMGSVWAAEHVSLRTRCAIKFMERALAAQQEGRQRFDNEAMAAARLSSRHIVRVFDHGVDDATGRPYLVMELLRGEPLDQRLEREGTLELQEVRSIASDLGKALQQVHAAGIVHRDLKPENIFLVRDEDGDAEYAKLVDFGIAKFSRESGLSSSTETGAVVGTPQYMSPEQARGLRAVDQRADVWSLGVIVYRALTGRLPFDGESVADVLVKICTAAPLPPSTHVPLPPDVDPWMERSLRKEPAARFASVREQVEALQGPPSSAPADLQSVRSNPSRLLLGAVLVTILGAGAGLWYVVSHAGDLAAASGPEPLVEAPTVAAPPTGSESSALDTRVHLGAAGSNDASAPAVPPTGADTPVAPAPLRPPPRALPRAQRDTAQTAAPAAPPPPRRSTSSGPPSGNASSEPKRGERPVEEELGY